MDKQILESKIIIAALLHDIGKFFQRADEYGTYKSNLLKQEIKNLENVFCPVYKNHYSHKHVLWTAQFIANNRKQINGIFNKINDHQSILQLAASHHNANKNDIGANIIKLADWYSSAIDRTNDEGRKDEEDEHKWDAFKKKRMYSIFEGINSNNYTLNLPVEKLELSHNIYPKDEFKKAPDYKKLWDNFVLEFKKIDNSNIKNFIETLDNLLLKYTWAIPSSTINLPDVSLYDHLKTTAAFSNCLFNYLDEKHSLKNYHINDDESPVLLIGADISGIQSFIYDIVSQNAAKNLKGRSFYLQLLIDNILQKTLNELNLYSVNVIYSSGGGFYLLAPNTNSIKNKIIELEKTISDKIYKTHKTSLFIAVDYIEVSQSDIFKQKINEKWETLSKKLNVKKRQRYKNKIVSDYDDFFSAFDIGARQKRDAITGEEFGKNEKIIQSEDYQIKETTNLQIELGKILKNAEYWVCCNNKLNIDEQGFEICELGIFNYFLTQRTIEKLIDTNLQIKKLNNTDFFISSAKQQNIYGFSFYGGNKFPVDNENNPLTFDQLAGTGDFRRIAVLRMDIDNLGNTFSNGFTKNKRTFSRYCTLSRSLDFFVKGYINTIGQKNKYKNNSIIIYSGGDDLFIVGKWDIIIEMAKEINEKFHEWTCFNPTLTLSGGISIVPVKYPIMTAANKAKDAEEIAKSFRLYKTDKNAITLFNTPLNWDIDFPIVEKYKNKIFDFISSNELPHAFLSKIYSYHNNADIKNHKIKNLKILWMSAYDISRMKLRIKNNGVKTFINECQQNIFSNTINGEPSKSKYHFLELLNLATRWAELKQRQQN